MDLGFDPEKLKSAYLKLPDWQKMLITLAAVLVFGGLYLWFVYLPKSARLGELRQKLNKMNAEITQSRAIADNLPRFKEESQKMNEKFENALSQLPSSDEIPKLLKNMEAAGIDAGVEFLLFKRNPDINKDFYAEVPVQLELTGNYHDTAVFFDKLGKLPRIINISKLQLSNPKIAEGRVILNIKCTATTFKFLPEAKNKQPQKGAKRKK